MKLYCPTCKQPLRKSISSVSQRKPIRKYEEGIKTFADGREQCMTKAAKNARTKEVWERDGGVCQYESHSIGRCKKPVLCAWSNLHHLRKRSVGRDDRVANLMLICEQHHREHHHSGAGK